MKILIVSRWLWEERRRNGDRPGFFGELFHELAAKGVDVWILSQAAGAGPVPERHPVDGLNVHIFSRNVRRPSMWALDKIIKPWSGSRKAASDAKVIRRFVRQHGPFDAIMAQCEEPDGLSCALASLAGGMPPLLTQVHDLRYQFTRGQVRFVRQSSLRFVFRQSARITANSEQTAKWLREEYHVPGRKIGPCRIHLTAPFLAEAAQNRAHEKPAGLRVLFLGALNEKKAPDIFLRAAIELAPELPDATFVVVGGETSEDFHFRARVGELAARPQLAGRLEMTGRLEYTAVIDQIRRARVVVCPSRIETFSRTTIEAIALGRPVIVTETTGAAQWVGQSGAVIKANDERALAEAIRAWARRDDTPDASTRIVNELTAARAADDLLREIKLAIAPVPEAKR